MGDAVVEAEAPAWRDVRDKALELFSRTKDLRVGMYLVHAVVQADGLNSLGDCLTLMRGLVDRFWDGVHPKLDPEDDNDPTMRVNTLASLADPDGMLAAVRVAPLVESRLLGRFSLRDIEVATGKLSAAAGEDPPDTAAIDGAFQEAELEGLQSRAQSIDLALEQLQGMEAFLAETIGSDRSPDVGALRRMLTDSQRVLGEHLAARGEGETVEGEADGGGAGPQALTGQINSRQDVIKALDKACEYFSRHEPSSPVPLLLQRAKRLVAKDFMEIMRDLAPDGVTQAQTITGAETEE